jgi:hypothetical protein
MWAGIIGYHLIAPCILPAKLNGPRYLRFLHRHLLQLLEDVSLRTRQQMWFLHDAAPAHFTLAVQGWLGRRYLGRWIGRGPEAPVPWPPRSPDFTSDKLLLVVFQENAVYTTFLTPKSNFGNAYRISKRDSYHT